MLGAMACARHPDSEALHACTLCGSWFCEACLGRLAVPGSVRPILTCPDCGGLAKVAAERVPTHREDMADLARRPFDGDGLLIAAALGAPFAFTVVPMPLLQTFFAFVYLGCLASYYFETVDHVGRGKRGLPFSAAPISRADLAGALARGLACLAVAAGPAWAWSILVPDAPLVTAALVALGVALTPAAIVSVAVTGQARAALWPFWWARIIARAPVAYGRIVGVFIASSVVWALGASLAAATLGRIPFVGPFAAATVNAALAVLQATLVGGFLRRNAEELGLN